MKKVGCTFSHKPAILRRRTGGSFVRLAFILALATGLGLGLSFSFEQSAAAAAANAPEPPSGLRQFIGLIDYLRGDYPEAVVNRQIVNEAEYREMNDFIASAKREFVNLAPELTDEQRTSLATKLNTLEGLITERADHAEILAVTGSIKQETITVFGLTVGPEEEPNWQLAVHTYATHCASCHGDSGRGDGPAGVGLEPSPRNFHEAGVMAVSSPFKFFNILQTGIAGTAMTSYKDRLSAAELWSVSYYLSSLRHSEALGLAPTTPPAELASQINALPWERWLQDGLSLEDLAARSDDELRAWLQQKLQPKAQLAKQDTAGTMTATDAKAEQGLHELRRLAPFSGKLPLKPGSQGQEPQNQEQKVAEGMAYALTQITQAERQFAAGGYAEAERFLLDAYLYGFEKTEIALGLVDPKLNSEAERLFMEARGYARQRDEAHFHSAIANLRLAIERARSGYQAYQDERAAGGYWGEFISSFVIIVREGFEAFLVIAALIALLGNMGEARAKRWVHAGWLLALVAGGLTYIVFNWILQLSGFARESMEAICTGLAVILLFYTGFWLLSQSEKHKWDQYIKTKTKSALSSGRLWSIFSIAFIAVYREAAETVLFYAALFSTARSPMLISAGFVVGCLVLFSVCWGIVRFNLRLPLRQFFMVTSCLMVAISVVLAGKTVHELVEAGFLNATPLRGMPAIDLLGIYPSMETLAAQVVLLSFGAVLAYLLLRKKKDARMTP